MPAASISRFSRSIFHRRAQLPERADFEAPGDAGGNNQYNVIVSASDGTNPAVTGDHHRRDGRGRGRPDDHRHSASNTLIGGDDADTISGLGGNDLLQGNGGNDTLDGGTGTDNVNGGTGDDLIIVRGTEAQGDTMTGGTGIDTLRITGTADLTAPRAATSPSGTSRLSNIEQINGSGVAIQGSSGADTFHFSGVKCVSAAPLGLGAPTR